VRIVYLHQYFTTPQMSGGTRSYEFARRLVDAGHDVHMITSDREGSGKSYETVEDGIRVTWIPVAYSNHMSAADRIRAFFSFALKSARLAARSKADVIFATSTPLTIAIPGVYAKWRQGVPMVFEVRDLWPETPIGLGVLTNPALRLATKGLERFAYSQSDRIIALSEGMEAGVAQAGYPADRITVIPNASDIDRFNIDSEEGLRFRQTHSWLGDRPLLVYAGTLGYANDVSYMVRLAAATLSLDPEIRFLTVGDGKERDAVEQLARELGVLDRNFFMMPSVKKRDLPTVLSAATMASSWVRNVEAMWANSANKFFDSMAAGRPFAINHEGWQADILRSNQSGVVLSPTDYSAAAKSLVAHIRDEAWLEQARKNAFRLAESRFSRDILFQRFEHTLQAAYKGDNKELQV
jgi:glycosyltransferase involved in cell wall biosynthesis